MINSKCSDLKKMAALLPLLFFSIQSRAEDSLFHPTRENLMRDFNSDRPGSIVTPFTIDAGHVQIETQVFNVSELKTGSVKVMQYNYPVPNFRVGLTPRSEVEISVGTLISDVITAPNALRQTSSGFGDVVLHYKYTLNSFDHGASGFALFPGLKLPSNTGGVGNNAWEPSFAIPFTLARPAGWILTFVPEIDLKRNSTSDTLHGEMNYPLNVFHHLFGRFDGFAEGVIHTSGDRSIPTTSYLGSGMTMRLAKNSQVDLDCNFGLNRDTPRYSLFLGWSYRL